MTAAEEMPMRILIVDDDSANLKLLRYLLESENHDVVEAVHGEQALQRARESRPDLAISDILMPGMDGFNLCRAWTKDPELRTIPFVFYTATYLAEEDEAFGLALGARAFLIKPMEPAAFMDQVRRILQDVRSGALPASDIPVMDEQAFLEQYNQRLLHKLEQRAATMARSTAALQESEASLRLKSLALEAAANGIVITDQAGAVIWANSAFTALTGFALEELNGQTLQVLKSGRHEPAFYRHLWNVIQAGYVWKGEIINRHRDGRLLTMGTAITPVRNEKGAITHFISIMQDLTERNRIENEMRQAQKMQAVGRLAGGMAHDFNNMLNVILLNAEIALGDEALPEPHRHHLLEIQQAGQRSVELTRQLLAFSRKQPASPKEADLNQVVAENQRMMDRLIGEDVELVFLPAADLWRVFLDPSQVSQVLANVVINARDAIAEKGRIILETANASLDREAALQAGELPPGDYVQLSVSDTGCGINPVDLEHIFEPFFTTKAEGKGTGLGLATVYGIVKQNRGAISVQSQLGIGTTMKIFFPRFAGEAEHRIQEASEAPPPRGTETLLMAEDEPSVLKVVKDSLEKQGYTVLAAASPGEALRLSEAHRGTIHLLLTDVVMPGMNGTELQLLIRTARPDIKTLFMSGYAGEIIAQRGLLEEGTHFLQKPFRILDLARKLREALDS